MTLIEAAKLAIDAAENDDPGRVIQLLSQAIAEAEQQEPVALAKELDGVIADVEEGGGFDDVCLDTVKYVRDQLAASPKREWQGLTDEEIAELRRDGAHSVSDKDFRAIEAKLKEKNT